jgi:hypothetical protein
VGGGGRSAGKIANFITVCCPESNCWLHEQKENASMLDLKTAINLF